MHYIWVCVASTITHKQGCDICFVSLDWRQSNMHHATAAPPSTQTMRYLLVLLILYHCWFRLYLLTMHATECRMRPSNVMYASDRS